ncbi:MAG: hypothetical protein IKZ37_08050 [Bacteroidaceae bacterium]|nr:hypothetical protein [Bacteroidaceae bacterium]
MSLETSSLKLARAMSGFADAGLSQRVSSCVKTRSIVAAIIMVIPLWGIEVFLYAIVLWGMYSELCRLANVPFWKNFFTSVLGGFIVNIIVVFILNFILDFIPIGGWIAAAIMGYCVTLFSGCAYLEVLAALHQSGKVKERFSTSKAFSSINNNKQFK